LVDIKGKKWVCSVEHDAESYVVNLNQGSCSCKSWELNGIPCPHSLAMLREKRLNPLNFVHDYYRTEYLRITYEHTFIATKEEDMWEEARGVEIKAPGKQQERQPEIQKKVRTWGNNCKVSWKSF